MELRVGVFCFSALHGKIRLIVYVTADESRLCYPDFYTCKTHDRAPPLVLFMRPAEPFLILMCSPLISTLLRAIKNALCTLTMFDWLTWYQSTGLLAVWERSNAKPQTFTAGNLCHTGMHSKKRFGFFCAGDGCDRTLSELNSPTASPAEWMRVRRDVFPANPGVCVCVWRKLLRYPKPLLKSKNDTF